MKTAIISYSLTGNNEKLAKGLAEALSSEHISIQETRKRTIGTIILDMLYNRKPRIQIPEINPEGYDLIIFAGPGRGSFPKVL